MFSFVLSFCTVSKVNWSSLVSKMTKPVYNLSYTRVLSNMVCPTGFEPAAFGVGVQRSIQLSYGHIFDRTTQKPCCQMPCLRLWFVPPLLFGKRSSHRCIGNRAFRATSQRGSHHNISTKGKSKFWSAQHLRWHSATTANT